MADCAICTEPITDTAYVCPRDALRLEGRLKAASELWPYVQDTVAKQTRTGDPTPRAGKPAPAEPIRPDGRPMYGPVCASPRCLHRSCVAIRWPDYQKGYPVDLPVDLAAAETRDAARNTVTTWARVLADELGADPPTRLDPLTQWVADQLGWARYRQWAGESWAELDYACTLLWRLVDRQTGRRYLGPCDADGCVTDLYARLGAEQATCPGCGRKHSVKDRTDWLATLVQGYTYTAKEISDAYPHIRADRIRKWASRGQLANRGDQTRPLYSLREVLALAERMDRRVVRQSV
jgi:hypothetical protein